MKLSAKHQAFCDEYLSNGFNATRAYKTVYSVSDKIAGASGVRLLENAKVKEYIEIERQKTYEKKIVTKEELLRDLQEIKDRNRGVRDQTAMKAIEIINKMSGFDAPVKSEITISEQPLLPDDED